MNHYRHMTRDQILRKIDACLNCSLSGSTWARKYWHEVARVLEKRYVN